MLSSKNKDISIKISDITSVSAVFDGTVTFSDEIRYKHMVLPHLFWVIDGLCSWCHPYLKTDHVAHYSKHCNNLSKNPCWKHSAWKSVIILEKEYRSFYSCNTEYFLYANYQNHMHCTAISQYLKLIFSWNFTKS